MLLPATMPKSSNGLKERFGKKGYSISDEDAGRASGTQETSVVCCGWTGSELRPCELPVPNQVGVGIALLSLS